MVRIQIDGKKKTYKDWSKKLKIPESVLRTRYSLGVRGASLRRKVNSRGKVVTFMGRKGTVQQLAKRLRVNYHMMWCAVHVAKKVQRKHNGHN